MKRTRIAGLLVVVTGALLAVAPSALAQSTTMYPASDSISASSTPITFGTGPLMNVTCTLSGGTFTVPSKGNPSGAVSGTYTTLPSFTACTKNLSGETVTIETKNIKGPWTMNAQYGVGNAQLLAPVEAIWVYTNGTLLALSTGNSLTGWWSNGFTSPFLQNTTTQLGGTVTLECQRSGSLCTGGASVKQTVNPVLESLTDLTHPASLPVVGP